MSLFAEVVFPLPIDQTFHYLVPEAAAGRALPGARIRAPLGSKIQAGFIIAVSPSPPAGGFSFKEIREVLDVEPALTPAALAFARKLAAYHRSPLGEFLPAMLPPSLEFRATTKVKLTEAGRAAREAKVLRGAEAALAKALEEKTFSLTTLKRRTGLKSAESVIRRMAAKGWIGVMDESRAPKRPRRREAPAAAAAPSQLVLDFSAGSAASADLLDAASAAIASGEPAAFYLFGPEEARWSAYLRLIRETRERSRAVVVLAPDLDRAESLRDRIASRLGLRAVLVHGGIPPGQREREWRELVSGRAGIAVGPRSVLFAPIDRPGLVIVDDEADESYVQSESPAYDARTGARLRAEAAGAVLVLGAEAPGVEAFEKASAAGSLLELPARGPSLPVSIVDDSAEKFLLSAAALAAVGTALVARKRTLVFLSRRGYASFLFCPRCGAILRCPDCGTPLLFSKADAALSCRFCRSRRPAASACPECGSRVLEPRGAGVEAVEEELRRRFPDARIAVFDRPRTGSRTAQDEILADFAAEKIDLLIGTERLAAARPARSPLVVVLNPEALLGSPDFRASQRAYRAVRRMLGFAGPEGRSKAIIQTAFPDHHSFRAAARGDYRLFFDEEIRLRRALDLPPFAALAEVLFWGGTPRLLAVRARDFVTAARAFGAGVEIYGPALGRAPVGKGGRGVQVVLKARRTETIDACLEECLKPIPGRRSVVRADAAATSGP